MRLETIELSPLATRAAVSSVDKAARTVDLIFSTGAAVDRRDWMTGKPYREVLSMNPAHVRLDRLNAGAPLLNSHSAYSLSDVIGTIEPGSARIAAGQGVATVRFSKRDDVEAIWQDVIDGIIRSVSVGYRVYKLQEETAKDGGIATRTAIDWEPFEISMVSMPADTGAKVRGERADAPAIELNHCEIWPASTVAEQDAEQIRRFERASALGTESDNDSEDANEAPVLEPARKTYRHQMSIAVVGVGPMQVRWNDAGSDIDITTTLGGRDLAIESALKGALRYIEELTGEIAAVRQHRDVTIKRVMRDMGTNQIAGTIESSVTV